MIAGIVEEHGVAREQNRALQRAAQVADQAPARRVPRLVELPFLNRPLLNLLDFGVNRLFDLSGILAGCGHRFEIEERRALSTAATPAYTCTATCCCRTRLSYSRELRPAPITDARALQRIHVGIEAARHLIRDVDEREPRERILTTVRRSSFCGGSAVSSGGGGGPDGMLSKYFRTFSSAVFASTSPAIASTALFGA